MKKIIYLQDESNFFFLYQIKFKNFLKNYQSNIDVIFLSIYY